MLGARRGPDHLSAAHVCGAPGVGSVGPAARPLAALTRPMKAVARAAEAARRTPGAITPSTIASTRSVSLRNGPGAAGRQVEVCYRLVVHRETLVPAADTYGWTVLATTVPPEVCTDTEVLQAYQ